MGFFFPSAGGKGRARLFLLAVGCGEVWEAVKGTTVCRAMRWLSVEQCGGLRASLGWMGFAASFLEPLLAPVCTPSQEGWRGASLLQASELICPCLLLVLLWGIQLCQAAAGFIFHQRASLCHRCRTRFFLSCPIPDPGIRTSLCTLPPTARPGRGRLGEEEMWLALVTEDLSLQGSPQVTCPCSPAQVCRWPVELGPHQELNPCLCPHPCKGSRCSPMVGHWVLSQSPCHHGLGNWC